MKCFGHGRPLQGGARRGLGPLGVQVYFLQGLTDFPTVIAG